MEPGYLKPKYDFIWLVDNLLDQNIHLDNLCVFDEVIRSETSFHCTICNKCSDNYDHHCPFIDNCLGTRNHKYFLLFLFSYFPFTLFVTISAIARFLAITGEPNNIKDSVITAILLVLISLPIPVVIFQLKEQCKKLNQNPIQSKVVGDDL